MADTQTARRPSLSACIVTLDEEDRLGDCLASLRWCDEILVVDSHSTDRTREIAAAAGARVIERDWPGHVAQKEYAVRQARHDWVLCIDADERVSPELEKEIAELRAAGFPDFAGWTLSRVSSYLGRWIRHGTWYPDLKLRLFDRRRGRWAGRDPHDRVEVDGPVGRLRGELLHHPYRNLEEHLATIERYTAIMARELNESGRRARLRDLVLRPPARFFVYYVLRGGWLDGWRGLLMAYLAAHYVRLKYAKLWVLQRT
ncbi:MAG TPA: glycosyltransferase family 2 protein [Myxococcota bacterium]